jgi:hypothetical protein
MLKVYVDDSSVDEEPVSVLVAWAADEATRASLKKEWTAALVMPPWRADLRWHWPTRRWLPRLFWATRP